MPQDKYIFTSRSLLFFCRGLSFSLCSAYFSEADSSSSGSITRFPRNRLPLKRSANRSLSCRNSSIHIASFPIDLLLFSRRSTRYKMDAGLSFKNIQSISIRQDPLLFMFGIKARTFLISDRSFRREDSL